MVQWAARECNLLEGKPRPPKGKKEIAARLVSFLRSRNGAPVGFARFLEDDHGCRRRGGGRGRSRCRRTGQDYARAGRAGPGGKRRFELHGTRAERGEAVGIHCEAARRCATHVEYWRVRMQICPA